MVAFTVMDHDVLTANDFAGEAFLALGSIPGVADTGAGVDNFHGLKPVELVLMQQHQKSGLEVASFFVVNKECDFLCRQSDSANFGIKDD